jgi:hypothetical protein
MEKDVLNIETYQRAYGEKDGKYLVLETEEETDLVSIRTGDIGTHSPIAIRLEQQYLKSFLELSGWDTTTFTLSGIPDLAERKLKKRFPMFSLSRQHLKEAGLKDEYLAWLDDTNMQKISTHAGELLLADGRFHGTVNFAAWNLILGTKLDKLGETDEDPIGIKLRGSDKQGLLMAS